MAFRQQVGMPSHFRIRLQRFGSAGDILYEKFGDHAGQRVAQQ